jgi:hypothetical protein
LIQDEAFVVGLLETQNAPKRIAPMKRSAAHAASMFSFEALSTAQCLLIVALRSWYQRKSRVGKR